MKKSLKFLAGFFVLGTLYFVLGTRYSALGTVLADTGSVSYTGTLSQFLTQEKNDVNSTFDTTYQRVYAKFQASGLNLMKTLNYQSLVCLGVMKQDDSLLNQMKKDRQELRLSFLKDFLEIEAEIATLEETHRIQGETDISLFTYGTSYESEKARIAAKIEDTKNLHLGFIRNFESTHVQKLQDFINNVLAYSRENTGVVNFVNDKLRKLKSIEESFAALNSGVTQINTLLIGDGTDFLANAESIRTGFTNGLTMRLQPLIDAALKKYKKFPTLKDTLDSEKEFAVRNYGLDFDEKMNTIMSAYYNKKDYEDVKAQIKKFKDDFTSEGKLSCPKMYASSTVFENRINLLLGKLQTTSDGLTAGLETAGEVGSSQIAKNKLLAGFTEFNKQNLTKKITAFKKIIRNVINGVTTTNGASTITNIDTTANEPAVFTRPFKKGEKGTAIKTLQELLKNNGYYNGEINSTFTKQTIEGIYQLQLKNGLLKGYEKKPETRGWMGPATRAKLNEFILVPSTEYQVQSTGQTLETGGLSTGGLEPAPINSGTVVNPYQPIIRVMLRGKITVEDKIAALEKSLANLAVSLAKMSDDNSKLYLQGFQAALQAQLDALQ